MAAASGERERSRSGSAGGRIAVAAWRSHAGVASAARRPAVLTLLLVLQSGVDGREETDEPGDEGSIEGREGIGERPAGDGAAAEAEEGGRQWLRHGGKVASDASSIG